MSEEPVAKEIMEKDVQTIDLNKNAVAAAKLMAEKGGGAIVVVQGEVSVGIVTERDLVANVISEGLDPAKVLVRDIMSTPLISAKPDAKISDIANLMMEYRIRRVVIIDETGFLSGMVSASDLARTLAKQKSFLDPTLNVLARMNESPLGGPYQ